MNMQQIDDMIAEYELALKLLHEKRREIINREQKKDHVTAEIQFIRGMNAKGWGE